VKLWDTSIAPRAPLAFTAWMMLSPDGARAVNWGGNSSVIAYDAARLHEPGRVIAAPARTHVLPSAHGLALIDTAGKLQTLEPDGSWRAHSLNGLTAGLGGALSPDGRFAALLAKEFGGLLVWDVTNSREVLRATNGPVTISPTFAANSRRLACTLPTGKVRVWELPSGRELASWLAHKNNYAYACDFSPDGRHLATAGFDGWVRLWEVEGARLLGEFRSTADAYWTVALAPDGRRIAAGTSESSIVMWDVPSRQEVATFQIGGPLGPAEGLLRFTPDGAALLHANGVLNQWAAPMPAAPVR
jgi:WD40 repeat protein